MLDQVAEATVEQAKSFGISFGQPGEEQRTLAFTVQKKGRRHTRVKLTRNKIEMFLPKFTDTYHEAVFRTLALNAYAEVSKKGWPENPGVLWGAAELAEADNVKVWTLGLTHAGKAFLTVFPPKPPEESKLLVEATEEQIKQVQASKGLVSLS